MFFSFVVCSILCSLAPARGVPDDHSRTSYNIPITRHTNEISMRYLVQHDLARAIFLSDGYPKFGDSGVLPEVLAHGIESKRSQVVDIYNSAVIYVANVGVGDPPTEYSLIIDTGSSNTWLNATKPYVQTVTSIKTDQQVGVLYGSGWEYLDRVIPAPGFVINNQSIGVAQYSYGFDQVDGILGLGPVDLTIGALYPANKTEIPTVTDNLYSQGQIHNNLVGIGFKPYFSNLTILKFAGQLNYTPRTTRSPSKNYWGIDMSVNYGSTSLVIYGAGIVDTDAFGAYQNQTGAILDQDTGLLRITLEQYSCLQLMTFTSNGHTFELIPDAQIWPRKLNEAIGGSLEYIYLVVADLGQHTGSGMDFVIGYAFLERYYTVYDSSTGSVGFGMTPATYGVFNY
ncbi:family A1 protease [Cyathus striatus]|nr:family A1 protease [Cyathus striatus]